MIYGYARVSTQQQNIARQIDNMRKAYDSILILEEKFTGTKIEGRSVFNKLLSKVVKGDTIVFDSVSRMSRNAEEGMQLYEELFKKGIELVFLKEPHINTSTYKKALSNNIELTGTNLDLILNGINEYLIALAKEQIKIAFDQSEKEVMDLRQRTSEGMKQAKLNGARIGNSKGDKLVTKKSIKAKEEIKKYSKDFLGTLKDVEVIKLVGINRNTYYKYKKELIEELSSNQ